jgi:hypothetical protein
MNTVATSKDTVRPLLGRPPDQPEDVSKDRVLIQYGRNGTVIKTRLKQSLTEALNRSRTHLQKASGRHFSQTILVRRALDLYAKQVSAMDVQRTEDEARVLIQQYR